MFTYKVKLKPTNKEKALLEKRFDLATKLASHLARKGAQAYELKKQHPSWIKATEMLEEVGKKNKDIDALFKEATQETFTDFFTTKDKVGNTVKMNLDKRGIAQYTADYNRTQGWNVYLSDDNVRKLSEDIWKGIEKVNFKGGNKIHTFKEVNRITGGSGNSSISFKWNTVTWNIGRAGKNQRKMQIQVDLKNDDYEKQISEYKIANTSIQRTKNTKGDYDYTALVVLDGKPPVKYNSVKGDVGIDIGVSTVAIVEDRGVILEELAKHSTSDLETAKITELQQRYDKLNRINNPLYFNEDGTIKNYQQCVSEGIVKPREKRIWHYSKEMKNIRNKIATLKRKQMRRRNLEHKELANRILASGDRFVVEQMSFAGLAKRAKETKISEKTGLPSSKKRFGAVIGDKAPASFIEILKYKAKYQDKTFITGNTFKLKASQLDHVTNECTKMSLGARSKEVGGAKVQRDLYSALLLQCVNDDGQSINLDLVAKRFPKFLENQDVVLADLANSGDFTSSMGVEDFFKKDA